jgi:hypothetical protein
VPRKVWTQREISAGALRSVKRGRRSLGEILTSRGELARMFEDFDPNDGTWEVDKTPEKVWVGFTMYFDRDTSMRLVDAAARRGLTPSELIQEIVAGWLASGSDSSTS